MWQEYHLPDVISGVFPVSHQQNSDIDLIDMHSAYQN